MQGRPPVHGQRRVPVRQQRRHHRRAVVGEAFDYADLSEFGIDGNEEDEAINKHGDNFSFTFVVALDYIDEVSQRLGLGANHNDQDTDISKPTAPDARVDILAHAADFEATDDDIFGPRRAPRRPRRQQHAQASHRRDRRWQRVRRVSPRPARSAAGMPGARLPRRAAVP